MGGQAGGAAQLLQPAEDVLGGAPERFAQIHVIVPGTVFRQMAVERQGLFPQLLHRRPKAIKGRRLPHRGPPLLSRLRRDYLRASSL
jgi:hypothetical protein